MTTGRKFFSGNTLEIALMQAARHHGMQPEEVAYRKVEKRHGFLRARKGVVIEVDPESPRTQPGEVAEIEDEPKDEGTEVMAAEPIAEESSSMDEGRAEVEESSQMDKVHAEVEETSMPAAEVETEDSAEPVSEPAPPSFTEPEEEANIEELIDAAKRGLEEIMGFAKLDLEAEIKEGDECLEIELRGADRERLVEDRGNLLLAVQHLLPRLIRGYAGRSIPCHVDSENFHAEREVKLRKLAEEAAAEVVERQRSRTLPPMNPAERRIIHVTLADNKEINTESQGKGFFKRVAISPAARRPRGFERYNR